MSAVLRHSYIIETILKPKIIYLSLINQNIRKYSSFQNFQYYGKLVKYGLIPGSRTPRSFYVQPINQFCENSVDANEKSEQGEPETEEPEIKPSESLQSRRPTLRGLKRDQVIPVETSIRYMQSAAYKETYKNKPVWKWYRRNFKGGTPPQKTRVTCIKEGLIATGNPCVICRDEYLVLHYKNLELLKQFIDPFTGDVLETKDSGLCIKKHSDLMVAVEKARDFGLLEFDVPRRFYDYEEFYPHLKKKRLEDQEEIFKTEELEVEEKFL